MNKQTNKTATSLIQLFKISLWRINSVIPYVTLMKFIIGSELQCHEQCVKRKQLAINVDLKIQTSFCDQMSYDCHNSNPFDFDEEISNADKIDSLWARPPKQQRSTLSPKCGEQSHDYNLKVHVNRIKVTFVKPHKSTNKQYNIRWKYNKTPG